jgi:TonB family protein
MKFTAAIALACIAHLLPAAWAQETSPPTNIFEIQKRADALMEKARELSDIHSPNGPSFRLKATFSFTGKDLDIVEGTYTEVWVSRSKWMRETNVKNWRRIETAGLTRLYRLDNETNFPAQASRLSSLTEIFPSAAQPLEYASISDSPATNARAQCAVTEPDTSNLKSAFCFEKKNGLLLKKIVPEIRPRNVVAYSCEYNSFHKVLNRWFPYEINCYEDRHLRLSARIVEISPEPSPDPALFAAPQGAIELGNCPSKLQPPHAVSTPEPTAPPSSHGQGSEVVLSVVVDEKGQPQNVQVASSGGATFDEKAIKALRQWRFKPAICNGEPMPAQMNVEFDFPAYR